MVSFDSSISKSIVLASYVLEVETITGSDAGQENKMHVSQHRIPNLSSGCDRCAVNFAQPVSTATGRIGE
jgi:hypothetical protein